MTNMEQTVKLDGQALSGTAEAISKLELMVRSRETAIVVETPEEQRFTAVLDKICKAQGKALIIHSVTGGFRMVNSDPKRKRHDPPLVTAPNTGTIDSADCLDPQAALAQVNIRRDGLGDDQVPRAIYLFKDLGDFFGNPLVVRQLRDLVLDLLVSRKTIIIMGVQIDLPLSLEKEVTRFSFPLPDRAELAEIINNAVGMASKLQLPDGGALPVDLGGDTFDRVVSTLQGLTQLEATAILRRAMTTNQALDAQAIAVILEQKRSIFKGNGRTGMEYVEATPEGDVGGNDLLVDYALEVRAAQTPAAREYGLPPLRGALFVGITGTGKSLMAKVMAGSGRDTVRIELSALMGEGLLGQAEAALRAALARIEAAGEINVWFDEIDKTMGGMGSEVDGGTTRRMFQTMLTWLEEKAIKAGVYVIATANSIAGLRPELLNRFDDVFGVDAPGVMARRQIFAIHLAKVGRNPEAFDLDALVAASDGYVGREIEKGIRAGMRRAFFQGQEVTAEHIIEQLKLMTPATVLSAEDVEALRALMGSRMRPASSEIPGGIARAYTAAVPANGTDDMPDIEL